MVSQSDIQTMAKTVKSYFVANKTYPKSVLVKGTQYSMLDVTYLMNAFVAYPQKDIPQMHVKGASNPNGDRCNRKVIKSVYQDMAKRCNQYIKQNGKLPNYVTILGTQKCSIILWMFQLSKIVSAYNGKLPDNILINSADLQKPQPKPVQDEVYAYFTKVFGKVNTIDDALAKVQDCGYGYYYDDKLSNKQTIDGLANPNGTKPNCTDIHHVFWHIGKALGYDVRAVHVICRSGTGHIRLDFKHPQNTGNQWIHRDASAVADGNCITCIWCENGEILSYNPSWFLENVNR